MDAAASTVEGGVLALIIGGISAEMESSNLRFAFISENGTLREVRGETEARKLCGKIPRNRRVKKYSSIVIAIAKVLDQESLG